MANWCSTSIVFEGDRISEFYNDLKTALKQKPREDADDHWLGQLFVYKGIDCSGFSTRSFVQNIDFNDSYIRLDNEDAWAPMTDAYDKIAELYELTYDYVAEELGCGILINTDTLGRFFRERYYFSYYDRAKIKKPTPLEKAFLTFEDVNYFESLDEIIDVFAENGIKCESEEDIKKLIKDYENSVAHEDVYIYFGKYETE